MQIVVCVLSLCAKSAHWSSKGLINAANHQPAGSRWRGTGAPANRNEAWLCLCLSSHHSPLQGVIEPLQQLNGGALSTAAASHQGQSLSLLHLQVQPLQDGHVGPRRVVKADTAELHVSVIFILQGRGRRRKRNFVSRRVVNKTWWRQWPEWTQAVRDVPATGRSLTGYRWQTLCELASLGEQRTIWPWRNSEWRSWPLRQPWHRTGRLKSPWPGKSHAN